MALFSKSKTSTSAQLPVFCASCSNIPLNQLLSSEDRAPSSTSYLIGSLADVEKRQNCALYKICQQAVEDTETLWQLSVSDREGCLFHIKPKATNRHPSEQLNPEWYSMRSGWELLIGSHAYLEISLRRPNRDWPEIHNILIIRRVSEETPGFHLQDQKDPSQKSLLSDPQLLRLMRSALECKQIHKSCGITASAPSQNSVANSLYLIDVNDRTIKAAEPDAQYITLSYRWAKKAESSEEVTKNNTQTIPITEYSQDRIRTLPDYLPPMIEDVLQVVRRLGQRFLWIDSYCINQKDPVEVQNTVLRMDDIYENSLLTICPFWTDTDGGLPGIGTPFKR